MKLTQEEKQTLFQLYRPGSAIKSMETLENDIAALWKNDPKHLENIDFSPEGVDLRQKRRAEHVDDLMAVEWMAFHKGVDIALRWLEEHK